MQDQWADRHIQTGVEDADESVHDERGHEAGEPGIEDQQRSDHDDREPRHACDADAPCKNAGEDGARYEPGARGGLEVAVQAGGSVQVL